MIPFNNNTSSNSGTYNWRLDNNATHFGYFAHNHSHNGGSGDVDDGFTWADIGEGDNITGDPRFKLPSRADFSLGSLSPLRDAGVAGVDIGAVPSRNSIKPWFLERRQRHTA